MKTPPWFPFRVGEFELATRHLTATQVGAFVRLLSHQWEHRSIPNDPGVRARIAGVHPPHWSKIWEALAPLFTPSVTADQRLVFDPLLKEYIKTVEISNNNKMGGLANAHIRARGLTLTVGKEEKKQDSSIEIRSVAEKENVVVLDSAAQRRLRPSGGQEEQRGLSNFDGSVSFTDKELGALSSKCHLVKAEGIVRELMDSDFVLRNKAAHRKKLVINLVQKAHDKRAREVANVVGNIDTPLISPEEQRERQDRSAAAAEFQKRQDEKIRRRRAAAQQ